MAFSFRKIISNISYFKKEDQSESSSKEKHQNARVPSESADILNLAEPDSTSVKLPDLKGFAIKNGSNSDTDLLTTLSSGISKEKKQKRHSKKLKVDIRKASKSFDENLDHKNDENVENTPKKLLLECKSSEIFSERIKKFDFDQSFDLFEAMSEGDNSPFEEENLEIESLSSDSEEIDKTDIKMCRKVEDLSDVSIENPSQLPPSYSLESLDINTDGTDEKQENFLHNYESKLKGIESSLKKMFYEFNLHIEASKKQCRSATPKDMEKIPENDDLMELYHGISPAESWDMIWEQNHDKSLEQLENKLLSIKQLVQGFVNDNLKKNTEKKMKKNRKIITYKLNKNRDKKKLLRHFDFPDYREAFINLFTIEKELTEKELNKSIAEEIDHKECSCTCHGHSESDSGLTTNSTERSMSITSSIGNFSLDSSTLTAYSESLDMIISYNSFQDTSLYGTLLQKVAIERLTFYVQVHSIQVKVESDDAETQKVIFHCPACSITESDEHGLLKHILSQYHCEKIHFLYKTAYIKKCVQSGKEIQPSTVLNPMRMYRDDNKIVCFGDAMYACSLCFENLIVGESVLMAHCNESEHVERRDKLYEVLE